MLSAPLDVFALLIIRKQKGTSLLVKVGNVCLWGIHSGKKVGECMIWMQKNFLFLEMSNLLKMCSRLVLPMMLILSPMRIMWVKFMKILRTWVSVMKIVVWKCIVVIKGGRNES